MSDIRAQLYNTAAAVTPSDTISQGPFHALLVTVAGTLSILPFKGSAVSLTVIAGQCVLIQTTRVNATGTTATVVGLSVT
jgi:hypothetical protein